MRISVLTTMNNFVRVARYGFHTFSQRLMAVKPSPLKMPALSPTMTEGTIVKWLKKEGDAINPGDALCEIQTDKAIMALEVEEQGILAKILLPDDTKDVKIGTLIALTVEDGEDWKDLDTSAIESTGASSPPTESAPSEPKSSSTTPSHAPSKHLVFGPVAKTLLHAYGIEPSRISGSGPRGVLLKSDILKFIESNKLKPLATPKLETTTTVLPKPKKAAPQPKSAASAAGHEQVFVDIPHTDLTQYKARQSLTSKVTVPHSYCSTECNVDSLYNLRKQLKEDGIRISISDFFIKATATALQRVPEVNAQLTDQGVRLLPTVDIAVSITTNSNSSVQVITDVGGLGLLEIAERVKVLTERVEKGELKPQQTLGGNFTITNLGMFGINEFIDIVQPLHSATLAVGSARLVVEDEGNIRRKMTVNLSIDRRVVDEQEAARFLQELSSLVENPSLLLAALGPTAQLTQLVN